VLIFLTGLEKMEQLSPQLKNCYLFQDDDEEEEEKPLDKGPITISRELDEETGEKIWSYIEEGRKNDRRKERPLPVVVDAELKEYIPIHRSKRKEKDWIDKLKEGTNEMLKKKQPRPPINLQLLVDYGITIRIMVEDCQVGISNLYQAGIVRKVEHLKLLKFDPRDLVRDRKLFSFNHLVQLFQAPIPVLEKAGIPFSLIHLIPESAGGPQFLVADLEGLQFSLDVLMERGLNSTQLKMLAFTYSLKTLRQFGLTRDYIQRLGITKEEALLHLSQGGFGWKEEEFSQLMSL
jgi:hypothetical protein